MAERGRRRPIDEESFRGDTVRAVPGKDYDEITGEIIEPNNAQEEPTNVRTPLTGQEATHLPRRTPTMSMIDPSEWELEDAHEPTVLRDGTEARLRIIEVTKNTREDETESWIVRMEVPAEPYSKDIVHFLNVPSRKMDAKALNRARYDMLMFCGAFNIDRGRPFDPTEDWIGLEGWAVLSMRKSADYGEQNRVSKFIDPR